MTKLGYPGQPADTPWPIEEWTVASARDVESWGVDTSRIDSACHEIFGHGVDAPQGKGISLALVAVHRGRVIAERYGRQPASVFHEERAITRDTPLISWSMAKSITHAAIGILVGEGLIEIGAVAPISEWDGDDRRAITWSHLLQMRDGLDFVEDYVGDASGGGRSDVIDMLFGAGADDVASYARSRPLLHEPGSVWSYSSGTTNVLCGMLGELLGGREEMDRFLRERIFEPVGMKSAAATFDAAGTFIGSSYVHATARDFARFGYLYLRGGIFGDERILDELWVDCAHRQHAVDPDTGHGYGEHWWTWNGNDRTMAALGYEGQRTIVVPERDLVVVHLGKWETSTQPLLDRTLTSVIDAVPQVSP